MSPPVMSLRSPRPSRPLRLLLAAALAAMASPLVAVAQNSTNTTTPTPTSSPSPTPAPPSPAEEQERDSSLALFLVLFLLIFSFFVSYYLRVKRITAIHETIVGLFAGMLVGAVLRLGPGQEVQSMLSFSNTIMLNVLLPPIILASGYDLRQENFFRNFAVILAFAFAGTFISAIVIGVVVYLWSLADFTISLSILDCLIFGSTLSATDPVTILAIFNTKKVDPTLYSIIFGESLLNDAVSIVMFDTLSTFRGQPISISSIFHGFGLFLVVFTISMALGVFFGLACSLMLKHSRLSIYPQLESCLVALIAYTSYFFSNAVTMSGIVSLLFCGITLKHYAYHNMSRRTQRATRYTFQTLASLSENFIFIYLGLSLFTQEGLVFKPLFIVVTVAAVVFSRYVAVFPIASLINFIRRVRSNRRTQRHGPGGGGLPRTGTEDQLSREYQIMLFWAGLRGAVGFALSAGITGHNAVALQTTVLVTIVLTLLVFGGTTSQMLDILGIRTGVQDDEGDSSDDEAGGGGGGVNGHGLGMARVKQRRRRQQTRPSAVSPYRDDDEDDDRTAFMPRAKAGSSSPYDDDGDASDSSDVLPQSRGGAATAADLQGSLRAAGGARALLERGALIMRDGQWFQRIDDRYLKPYFSNAVASRKADQRRSQRVASRSALNLHHENGGENDDAIAGGHAIWGDDAAADEPDADVFPAEDEDADDETSFHHLNPSSFPPSSSSGRSTPRIRSSVSDAAAAGAGTGAGAGAAGTAASSASGHSRRAGSSSGVGGAFA